MPVHNTLEAFKIILFCGGRFFEFATALGMLLLRAKVYSSKGRKISALQCVFF